MKQISYVQTSQNPTKEKLEEKLGLIQNYQSQRTAQEMHDAILETFHSQNIFPRKTFLRESQYDLLFMGDSSPELVRIVFGETNLISSVYFKNKKREVTILLGEAYQFYGMYKDIIYGRARPRQIVPIAIHLKEKTYPLLKNNVLWKPEFFKMG